MQLPFFKTESKDLDMLQNRWKSVLDPQIKNPLNNVSILKNIVLASGSNKIPHLLGRIQQGWFLVDINAAITVYRNSPFNDSFLYLTASGAATVSIGVY